MRSDGSARYLPPNGVSATSLNECYLIFLMLVLCGYAMFGRGFAYLGYAPVFIGEISLVIGMAALLWSNTVVAVLASPLRLMVLLLFAWVMSRTLPYVRTYGIDALRDSVIVSYSCFAFIAAGLILERPERLLVLLNGYRRFAVIFAFITPPLYVVSSVYKELVPVWPGSDTHILSLRPGDVAVHLCGIMLFAMLGFVRLPIASIISLFIGLVIVGSQNRGGALAIIVPTMLACVLIRRMKQVSRVLGIGGATLVIFSVLGVSVALPWDVSQRLISTDQLFTNISSIIIPTGDPALDGTKQWREQWWNTIVDYTIHGPYFWTGKGFGINLADSDGFQVLDAAAGPPLRSPHDAFLTMLARAGVPGLLLLISTCLGWMILMLSSYLRSRAAGQETWARVFVFVLCYWTAIVIDASFDVALEGPMVGIWFWTLFGVGIGASAVNASQRTAPAPSYHINGG